MEDDHSFLRGLSWLIGWIYFTAWSASCYPQPILNFRRKSVQGCAIDYPTINVIGFIAYTTATFAMCYSPTIRAQYAARNPQEPESTVRVNDVAYALHCGFMACLVYSQFWPKIWGFKVSRQQRASWPVMGICAGCITGILVVVAIVLVKGKDGGYDPSGWAWIDVIYTLGYVKLIVTVSKYFPQAWVNYKRKSTVGWSIFQIQLDFWGGVLSLLQLIIDASLESDWSGLTGNPAKFMLANITLVFDAVYFWQHYVLYRSAWQEDAIKAQAERSSSESDENAPLLASAV